MAADSILFIGWNRAVHGRERDSLEAFGTAIGFLTNQVGAGKVQSFEPVLLDRHGGDLNGFLLVRGSAANLAALADSDEFRDLVMHADMSVGGIGIVTGKIGEGLQREIARLQKHIK
jgi:hypothetical protein